MTRRQLTNIITLNYEGKMNHRESCKIEFKENFNFNSMNTYAKAMASFANRKGGTIIFGITDSPRKPIGMKNLHFDNVDPEKITNFLNQNFSPEIIWESQLYDIDNKSFGIFVIKESKNKPILATRNTRKDITKEGDIYYRYSGRSERIKYPELKQIFDKNREQERKFWAKHIEKIASIGPQNISLIDLQRGEIDIDQNEKLIIDNNILKKIKFIKQGHFVDKEGTPTLRLIGDIEGVKTVAPQVDFESDFHTTKELAIELNLLSEKNSTAYMSAVIRHYHIQNNSNYYKKNRGQHLYSERCLDFLKNENINLETAKQYACKPK
jgi:hypothetical protein